MIAGHRVARRFELRRRLGAGGMAVVYDAVDRTTGARVALKMLTSINDMSRARFKREFRATQDLQHPNLVRLHELFEDGDLMYFTMDLIDGVDFLRFVRRDAGATATEPTQILARGSGSQEPATIARAGAGALGFDELRLRDALGQLVCAVTALHDRGLVHRDIKPSNILVTRDGALRLLDFGLISDPSHRVSNTGQVVGTAAYMAPEQVGDSAVGPPADWYCVGVLLFEALTGTLPFLGSDLEVLLHKRVHDAAAPRTVVSGIPPDLDRLCESLLARVPAQRPGDHQIAAALGLDVHPPVRGSAPFGAAGHTMFVGRLEERRWLEDQFVRARRAGPVAVSIGGESGIGKSALVRHVLDELRNADPALVVLDGRCYENESVAYKGIDGIVEKLSQFLRHLPADVLAAMAPRSADALVLQFPALAAVPSLTGGWPPQTIPEPRMARADAMQALREILGHLTVRHPVVIYLDDVQWIDRDGRLVLHELLRPPEAPRVLLLVTHTRAVAGSEGERFPCTAETLSLGPLGADDARALVTACATRAGLELDDGEIRQLADEAQGHPIFLHELVHRAAAHGEIERTPLSLDDTLRARVAGLPAATRALLELAAVAGEPVPLQVAASAADVEPSAALACVAQLRSDRLLVTGGTGAATMLQPSHDRVRRAVTARLDSAQVVDWHRRIATALARLETYDDELLARHWSQAGDIERAAPHAARAAAIAARAFAFDRAASLFRQALVGTPNPDDRQPLLIGLGEALANAGRGVEAARAFLECLAGIESPDQALALHHRAADQLLRSGHIDEGLEVLHDVLAAVRVRLPRTPRATLVSLIYHRARIALRGLRHVERAEADVPADTLRRLDVCYSVASGLALVDIVLGTDFGTRCLLLALEAGEPFRLSRSLSIAACLAAGEVGRRHLVPGMFDAARALVHRTTRAEAAGWLALAQGIAAFQVGRFEDCLRLSTEAEVTFRDDCRGAASELTHARAFRVWPMVYLGQLRELAAVVPDLLRDFRDRGDRLGQMSLICGPIQVLGLAQDRAREMRAECQDSLASWTQRGFHFQHSCALDSLVGADLYEGLVDAAVERLEATWKEIERSLLLRVQFIRMNLWVLRGHVALAAAQHDPSSRHVPRVERAIATIERERVAWPLGHALAMRAGLARLRGDAPRACALLEDAERSFAGAAMSLYVAVCQLHRGALLGAAGADLAAQGSAKLVEQGVRRPLRLAAMLLPVTGPPEREAGAVRPRPALAGSAELPG